MLELVPRYKNAPWGGRRLEELGRRLPPGLVGESWELCDFDEHRSTVRGGPHDGESLGDLWRGGALGGSAKGDFPFLLKWLDTHDTLSVQVHPDEAACKALGEGRPKTEAWLVAVAEPKAHIFLGHYPGLDPATLRAAASGGTVHKWLYETQPRVGDAVLVPAGTLHAIGAGYVLLEVQQPSDTTYRVYDWGRTDPQGNARPLHIEQAVASVAYDRPGPMRGQRGAITGPTFRLESLGVGAVLEPSRLRVLVAGAAQAVLSTAGGEVVQAPLDVRVAQPTDGRIEVVAGSCVLITEP